MTEFSDDQALIDAVDAYIMFKRQRDENDLLMRAAQDRIASIAAREHQKTMAVRSEFNGAKTVTVVSAESLVYDEAKFKEAVGDKWKDLTIAKIDKTKIQKAVMSGDLDAKIVADCTTVRKSTPFVRISTPDTGEEI